MYWIDINRRYNTKAKTFTYLSSLMHLPKKKKKGKDGGKKTIKKTDAHYLKDL